MLLREITSTAAASTGGAREQLYMPYTGSINRMFEVYAEMRLKWLSAMSKLSERVDELSLTIWWDPDCGQGKRGGALMIH